MIRLVQSTAGVWLAVHVDAARNMVTLPTSDGRGGSYFVAGTGDASCTSAADFAVRFNLGRRWVSRERAVFYFTTDSKTINDAGWITPIPARNHETQDQPLDAAEDDRS